MRTTRRGDRVLAWTFLLLVLAALAVGGRDLPTSDTGDLPAVTQSHR